MNTRRVVIERHGPPDVLVERESPLADPGPDEVHLRVDAAGVNFADLAMRMGLYGTVPPRPYSPGFEVAGRVARVGVGVDRWKEGDPAVALLRHGGYARDVIVPVGQLFHFPEPLTPVEAAAIPVNFLTAWVALFEAARVRAGERALVLGAAGGVGTAVVQLCVGAGLHVIGTAGTPEKRAFVTGELGAEACFDSRGDWEREVRAHSGDRAIDVALDPVGGAATSSCRRLLAPLGRLVFYGLSAAMPRQKRDWPRAVWAWLKTPRVHLASLIQPNVGIFGIHLLHLDAKDVILGPALERIFDQVVSGELRPVLDREFPLDRAGAVAAHRYIHERRNLGKVVLAV